jgi:GTP-binding protein LepA
MQYVGRQVVLTYELPLNEVVMDFFDRLKSVSRGYASLDYDFLEYRAGDLVRLDILINGDRVDALSLIVHRGTAQQPRTRAGGQDERADPRQMFDVAVQAADRLADHRARERQGAAQERAREVLRRGHHAQEKAAREAESGEEAHEAGRHRRDTQEAFLAILKVES